MTNKASDAGSQSSTDGTQDSRESYDPAPLDKQIDDIPHILGTCYCQDSDTTCWYNATYKSLQDDLRDHEEVIRLLHPLQEKEVSNLVAKAEKKGLQTGASIAATEINRELGLEMTTNGNYYLERHAEADTKEQA